MKRTNEISTTIPPNGSNRISNFAMENPMESQGQNTQHHQGIIESEQHGIKERAAAIKDKASAQAHALGERVSESASALTERASRAADDLTTSVGKRLTSYSESLRERGEEGVSGRAASTLDSVGSYLQERDVEAMAHDVTNVIRKHPVESMLVGLGFGFLLGRMLSR